MFITSKQQNHQKAKVAITRIAARKPEKVTKTALSPNSAAP
jgi:hypothetical protein